MAALVIVLGNMFTGFGNSVYLVALLVAASNYAPGPLNIGLIQAAAYLPVFLLSIFGGSLADRANRGGIIAGTDLVRAVFLALAGSALARWGNPALMRIVLPLVLANAAMQALFTPAMISLSLDLQHRHHYALDLLSLRAAGGHLASLAGQILGGLLALRYGLQPLLYANGLVFLLSGLSEIYLVKPARHRPEPPPGGFGAQRRQSAGLGSLYAELQDVRKRGAPWALYLAFQVGAAFMVVSLPTLLKTRLGLGTEYVGYCLAALLAGSMATALFMSGIGNRLPLRRQVPLAHAGLGLAAAAAFAVSLVGPRSTGILLVLLLISGAVAGYLHIVTLHLVYRLGEPGGGARRQGAIEAAVTGIIPLGYLAGGLLARPLEAHIEWMFRLAALFLVGILLRERHFRSPNNLSTRA